MLFPVLVSLLAGSVELSVTARCSAAEAAAVEAFPKTSLPLALRHGLIPIRVKAFVGQYGGQLRQPFSLKAYQKDGSGGWAIFRTGHDPVGARPPLQQTLDAFMRSSAVDANGKCPNLAPATLKMGWVKPFPFRRRKDSLELYPYTSVTMSLPIIGGRNDEAIMWVDETSGPLAGSSKLLLLRLGPSAKWQVTGWFPISIS